MAQSRQTPRVWSDAIRGSEILANWVKVGSSAVVFWLSIGIALGGSVVTLWFAEGTTSLDRKLWAHHFRNSLGMGGRIADLPDPDGSSTRIQVAKAQVQRTTWRSYERVIQQFQLSLILGDSRRRLLAFHFALHGLVLDDLLHHLLHRVHARLHLLVHVHHTAHHLATHHHLATLVSI